MVLAQLEPRHAAVVDLKLECLLERAADHVSKEGSNDAPVAYDHRAAWPDTPTRIFEEPRRTIRDLAEAFSLWRPCPGDIFSPSGDLVRWKIRPWRELPSAEVHFLESRVINRLGQSSAGEVASECGATRQRARVELRCPKADWRELANHRVEFFGPGRRERYVASSVAHRWAYRDGGVAYEVDGESQCRGPLFTRKRVLAPVGVSD